jgi:hypothetical protein
MLLKSKLKKKKKKEKTQLLMRMVNIFKLLLKQELKLHNFNRCWLQVNKPLKKKSN